MCEKNWRYSHYKTFAINNNLQIKKISFAAPKVSPLKVSPLKVSPLKEQYQKLPEGIIYEKFIAVRGETFKLTKFYSVGGRSIRYKIRYNTAQYKNSVGENDVLLLMEIRENVIELKSFYNYLLEGDFRSLGVQLLCLLSNIIESEKPWNALDFPKPVYLKLFACGEGPAEQGIASFASAGGGGGSLGFVGSGGSGSGLAGKPGDSFCLAPRILDETFSKESIARLVMFYKSLGFSNTEEIVIVEDDSIQGEGMQIKFDDFLTKTCKIKLPIIFSIQSRATPSGTQTVYFSDSTFSRSPEYLDPQGGNLKRGRK
jgi:hypothetical protein